MTHAVIRYAAWIWLLALTIPAWNATPEEYEVKAAFLFNFAKFVEWPEETLSADRNLAICVMGKDPFGGFLDALAGRTVQGRQVETRRLNDIVAGNACHMVFVSRSESRHIDSVLTEIARHPGLLSVSDIDGFVERGGMIELKLIDNRVRFAVNLEAAREANLRVSSRLLNLAVMVKN